MDIGWHEICLKVENLERSLEFYEALGMQRRLKPPSESKSAYLVNGDVRINLMPFLDYNLLNFRGGDVFAIAERLASRGLRFEAKPERYDWQGGELRGAHWAIQDPDGNAVYFDTTVEEEPRRVRVERLLRELELELQSLDLDAPALTELRAQLLAATGSD